MPVARPQTANPVPHIDPVDTPCSLHRALMYRENHAIALLKRHDLHSRLHARPLLGQHKLTARKVFLWFREQESYLQRENMFAVKVLVQAIIIVLAVLEQ